MFFAHTSATLLFSLGLLGGVVLGANELRIHNISEFIDFSKIINRGMKCSGTTVYLESDIVFDSSPSQQLKPIGERVILCFQGTFDGQGHTISNLIINSSSECVGFFGSTEGAVIKNVVLDDSCSFTSTHNSSYANLGGISGWCDPCVIESIVNMASVTFAGNVSSNFWVGGVAGRFLGSSTIRNCVNYGPITHSGDTNKQESNLGGIAGMSGKDGDKFIQNCVNYGTITYNGITTNGLYMGGIVGQSYHGTINVENCVSAGKIVNLKQATINNFFGSVVGYIPSRNDQLTTITHCLWTSDVGYNNIYGYNGAKVTVTNSSLKELNSTTVDELNEYAEENSTWNK